MVKRILKNSLIYFGRLAATLCISMLIVIIVLGIVMYAFSDTVTYILRALLFMLISCGGLFYMSANSGYKNDAPPMLEDIVSGVLMGIYQILLAKLLKFVMYTSGAAYFTIQSYYAVRGTDIPDMYTVPDAVYIAVMLVFDVFYVASICFGGRMGVRKRQKDREKLTGRA